LSSFVGLHATHYDLVYADKPYAAEASFVAAELRRHGAQGPPAKLLDLACGTGRHALEFAALGYSVAGVDLNEELLVHARARAAEGGVEAAFLEQDLRELDVDGRPFDAITCLFDSIGYLQTNEAIVEALSRARNHLGESGLLAVEFLHAPAMLRHASPVRIGRWETPEGGRLVRISESRLDIPTGTLHVSYELFRLSGEGETCERSQETQTNRFFSLEEMRALMASAGLEVKVFVNAYDREEPISDRTFHVLAVAGRR
jgi:SAM-dependent methyltransferase